MKHWSCYTQFYDSLLNNEEWSKKKRIGTYKKGTEDKTRSHCYITDKSGHPTINILSLKKKKKLEQKKGTVSQQGHVKVKPTTSVQ